MRGLWGANIYIEDKIFFRLLVGGELRLQYSGNDSLVLYYMETIFRRLGLVFTSYLYFTLLWPRHGLR